MDGVIGKFGSRITTFAVTACVGRKTIETELQNRLEMDKKSLRISG